MSINVKTNIKDPLEWIYNDYGVWSLISDYTETNRYNKLDGIYHCIVDGIEPCNMTGVESIPEEKLKVVYQKEFPLLIAEAFENIAKDIKNGSLIIETEFD